MKQLGYLAFAFMIILLSACEQQPDTESTSAKETTGSDSGTEQMGYAATEPPSPFYALRVADNNWPQISEEKKYSSNLLANNYYIVLDGSGSMAAENCAPGTTKMAIAKKAISNFAKQIPADANIALFVFDLAGVNQRVQLANHNREQFFNQVKAMQPGGNTPLASALNFGYRQLQIQAAKQLGYGEYHLVVVTDGIATAKEEPDQIIQTILHDSPVVIHSIGFCIDENHSLNQPGKTYYTAAANADELQRGLQAVLAESSDFNIDNF